MNLIKKYLPPTLAFFLGCLLVAQNMDSVFGFGFYMLLIVGSACWLAYIWGK